MSMGSTKSEIRDSISEIDFDSVTRKMRFSLLEESSHAFMAVIRFETTELSFGLITQHFLQTVRFTGVDRLLGSRQRYWRCSP